MAPDFCGYVTKANIVCSDGRTIKPEAFKQQHGSRVPLVWNHQRNDVENVLGYVDLEHRGDGVYGRAFFNSTTKAQHAKKMVQHLDVDSMSIFANQLIERAKEVYHGVIGEVSLVLKGANSGAKIDPVTITHSDGYEVVLDDAAIIYSDQPIEFEHADDDDDEGDGVDIRSAVESMNEAQRTALDYLVQEALNENTAEHSDDGGDGTSSEENEEENESEGEEDPEGGSEASKDESNEDGTNGAGNDEAEGLNHTEGQSMTRNTFEQFGTGATGTATAQKHLNHSQITQIVEKAKEVGSFKAAFTDFIEHAEDYGIQDIELLFPDAKAISNTPEFIKRRTEWVNSVLSATNHSPFSRVKTLFADITHEEARAKGYIKGNLKKEEFIKLSKRVTTPKTIYKKQKLDRDDVLDITDLDVVAWLKAEMRLMLEEELARAILIGDGREPDDDDKIDEDHIRPVAYDDDFFAPKVVVSTNTKGNELVEAVIRNRKLIRGSGGATFYTTTDVVSDMLLAKDRLGNRMYPTLDALARGMGVAGIVEVEVMEEQDPDLLGVLVNLRDYTIGTDAGGKTAFFDDFDIDYNQMKYLYETRLSGALTRWRSALVFRRTTGGTEVAPEAPTFNETTGVVTIPSQTGVTYEDHVTGNVLSAGAQSPLEEGESLYVKAMASTGYYFPHNYDDDWEFTRPVA